MKTISRLAIVLLFISSFSLQSSHAQQEGFIGEIRMFAGNFAPRGWAFCDGQLIAVSSNTALFSILGTIYGGDGRTTFALPDLRGRTPIGPGNGPGLSSYRLGQKGGTETFTLTTQNMPMHAHSIPTFAVDPNGADFKQGNAAVMTLGNAATGIINSANMGGSQPVNNVQPYVAIHYIICLQGTFPSRS